jgi:hypothetical protein
VRILICEVWLRRIYDGMGWEEVEACEEEVRDCITGSVGWRGEGERSCMVIRLIRFDVAGTR